MSEAAIINTPGLWGADFPRPARDGHKYDRGHAVIYAAPELTGATRLAAEACSRIGAGLVTVLAHGREDIYRTALLPDFMVRACSISELNKVTTILIGPGGVSSMAFDDLRSGEKCRGMVLDADALLHARGLCAHAENAVLTPHEGEFAKAFPAMMGTREDRARQAASELGATVILKGADTLIASSDGRLVKNTHASPYLAKAGTGDVLAGLVTGLVAQGLDAFHASCAAVWIHGEAAKRFGPGLVASDLQAMVPSVLKDLNIH